MRLFLRMSFVILLACSLSAGVYMKQKSHTDAMQIMGQTQPAKDTVQEIWITEQGFRSDNPEQSVIFDQQKGTMTVLDHQQKTYFEIPMGQDMIPGMMEGNEEGAAEMQQMMSQMMKMDILVEPTGEVKTIHDWPCKKYIMKINMAMGTIENEIWASESLSIDPKLYQQFSSSMFRMMPGMQQSIAKLQEEMKKIKGTQVMTISTNQIMGQKINSTTELVEIKEGKAPADLLKIPSGYTKGQPH
jgi:hypothetical protein